MEHYWTGLRLQQHIKKMSVMSGTPFHSGFGLPRSGIIIPFSGIIFPYVFSSLLLYRFLEKKLPSSEKLQEPVRIRSVYFRQFSPVFSISGNSIPFLGYEVPYSVKFPNLGSLISCFRVYHFLIPREADFLSPGTGGGLSVLLLPHCCLKL